jgi:hypothetical protein
MVVLLILVSPVEVIIRTEVKRYGLKFGWHDHSALDELIENRRRLEGAPPAVPTDLYSADCVITRSQ